MLIANRYSLVLPTLDRSMSTRPLNMRLFSSIHMAARLNESRLSNRVTVCRSILLVLEASTNIWRRVVMSFSAYKTIVSDETSKARSFSALRSSWALGWLRFAKTS